MYFNDLFRKQEMKYDLRDKTLLEQSKFSTKTDGNRSFRYHGAKLWIALPFEITNTDDYGDFKSKLTAWCHSINLDKFEIFWFFPACSLSFICIVFVCICISNLYKSLLIILRYIYVFLDLSLLLLRSLLFTTMLCFMSCEFYIYIKNDFNPVLSKSFHHNALSYIILSCFHHILFIQQRRYNFNMATDFIL